MDLMEHDAARSAAPGNKHILGLDLVRFIAAFAVMFFHLAFWSWWDSLSGPGTIHKTFPNLPQFWSFTSIAWFGWVGVQIFFVISGFVIAMSANGRTWREFAIARLLRIYPTAWISAIIIFPIYFTFSGSTISASLLRFLNTLIISPLPSWLDGVFWTLVVELVFYCLITVNLATKGTKTLPVAAWGMTIASALFLSLAALDLVNFSWPSTLFLLQHGPFFSLGIALYVLLYGDNKHTIDNLSLLLLSFVFSLFEIWLTATAKLEAFSYSASPGTPMGVWSFFVVVIFTSVKFGGWFSAAFSKQKGAIRTLGLMTYPLYLTHSLVGGATLFLLSATGMNQYMALAFTMLSCLVIAWVITKIEPVLRSKISNRKTL
jgi:peptidoglycan/LPS O-acetylase OafA/YrhL